MEKSTKISAPNTEVSRRCCGNIRIFVRALPHVHVHLRERNLHAGFIQRLFHVFVEVKIEVPVIFRGAPNAQDEIERARALRFQARQRGGVFQLFRVAFGNGKQNLLHLVNVTIVGDGECQLHTALSLRAVIRDGGVRQRAVRHGHALVVRCQHHGV